MDNQWIPFRSYCYFALCFAVGCSANDALVTNEGVAREQVPAAAVASMSLSEMFPSSEVRDLARAAARGDLIRIDKLLTEGVNVNGPGTSGATPLFWALREGNLSGFIHLLQRGANPNTVFADGGTVVHWAAVLEDIRFLDAALKAGGNINLKGGDYFGYTPLFDVLGLKKRRISSLLDRGADIDAQSSSGNTAVMVVSGRGDFETAFWLLERGANFKVRNTRGESLADWIGSAKPMMDTNSEEYRWMLKCINWLEAREVDVPDRPSTRVPALSR